MKLKMLLAGIASLLLFLHLPSPVQPQAITDDLVSFAQTQGLSLIKEGLSKDPGGYGYTDEAEIRDITVGEGMQIHYIDGAKLRTASDSLLETVIPQDNWEFLILSGGLPKSKMSIQKDSNGSYQVTEFGGNPETLAYVIQALQAEGDVSEPTLIRERGAYIAVFKKDHQELMFVPQQASSADPQPPEQCIDTLQSLQNDSTDNGKDGSGAPACI